MFQSQIYCAAQPMAHFPTAAASDGAGLALVLSYPWGWLTHALAIRDSSIVLYGLRSTFLSTTDSEGGKPSPPVLGPTLPTASGGEGVRGRALPLHTCHFTADKWQAGGRGAALQNAVSSVGKTLGIHVVPRDYPDHGYTFVLYW